MKIKRRCWASTYRAMLVLHVLDVIVSLSVPRLALPASPLHAAPTVRRTWVVLFIILFFLFFFIFSFLSFLFLLFFIPVTLSWLPRCRVCTRGWDGRRGTGRSLCFSRQASVSSLKESIRDGYEDVSMIHTPDHEVLQMCAWYRALPEVTPKLPGKGQTWALLYAFTDTTFF